MNPSVTSGEPRADGTCRVCGGALDERTGRCKDCGAVHGAAYRCPHCATVADVEADARLHFRCRVCGGPRIPIDDLQLKPSGDELAPLKEARSEHTRATAWRLGSAVVGGLGAASLLLALGVLALTSPGLVATLATLLIVATPLVLAALGLGRAKRHDAATEIALDRAWQEVARSVVEQRPDVDARALAKMMKVDEARAELLLAEVSVDAFVRTRVAEEPSRTRVQEDAPPELEEEPVTAEAARTRTATNGEPGA